METSFAYLGREKKKSNLDQASTINTQLEKYFLQG